MALELGYFKKVSYVNFMLQDPLTKPIVSGVCVCVCVCVCVFVGGGIKYLVTQCDVSAILSVATNTSSDSLLCHWMGL